MQFQGKTVLITGAAGNLGRAVSAAFRAAGATLVLFDADRHGLREACPPEDERTLHVAVDLLKRDAVSAATEAACRRFGRVDVLCNLAGAFRMGEAVHETTDETWQLMLDVNARSVVHMARAVVPGMIAARSGRIVNVAALAAVSGKPAMGAYVASKSAVIRLTETMAAELGEHGINVNCVLPGTLDTPQNRAAMPGAEPGRWVAPAALADVLLFLASDAARAIHGAAIPVSGLG